MMKNKKKACKGIGKAFGFEGCGSLEYDRRYGLGKRCGCYAKWLLNTEEGKKQIEAETIKAKKPKEDLRNAREQEKEEKSLSWLKINTRTACHDYIKLRDRGKPCVSCDSPWNKEHQAGHWKKAELYSTLKFDERNIHNQCKGCNLHKDGNVQNYADRIHNRIGRDGKEELERLAELEKATIFKWDREELKKIRAYYKQKFKELKKSLHLE